VFKKATKAQSYLRMTIDGPAGSGKTYTALRFAHALAEGGKIAVIDTERGSASKYAGEAPDGVPWEFDVLELHTFSPTKYIEGIQAAMRAGYKVLVIDSLSHAWSGTGGVLDMKDRVGSNSFDAWRQVTPLHNKLVDTILQAPLHVITTMRSKMDYAINTNEQGKITGIQKVGMAPIQRSGMEYEFDIVVDMDWAHIATVSKSRCSAMADATGERPGPEFIAPLVVWLKDGVLPAPSFAPSKAIPTLDDLLAQYGAEAIMAAAGGVIPSTPEEITAVVEALENGS